MAQNALERIGGYIYLIESSEEQGSTFAIDIPIIAVEQQNHLIKEKVLELS